MSEQTNCTEEGRHPTLKECYEAGVGPSNYPGKPYEVGGMPDTPEERERFEAYMRGHCWAVGHYVEALRGYDTVEVRRLYGVWRDRGSLPTTWNTRATPESFPKGREGEDSTGGVDLPHGGGDA